MVFEKRVQKWCLRLVSKNSALKVMSKMVLKIGA